MLLELYYINCYQECCQIVMYCHYDEAIVCKISLEMKASVVIVPLFCTKKAMSGYF